MLVENHEVPFQAEVLSGCACLHGRDNGIPPLGCCNRSLVWFATGMSIMSLDSLMTPVAECMDEASLRALIELRATPAAAERVAWLAERVNEGEASAEERSEYESCVMCASFLGVLQSKARRKFQAAS